MSFNKQVHTYIVNPDLAIRNVTSKAISDVMLDDVQEVGIITKVLQYMGFIHTNLYYLPFQVSAIRYCPATNPNALFISGGDTWYTLEQNGKCKLLGKGTSTCILVSFPYHIMNYSLLSQIKMEKQGDTQRFYLDFSSHLNQYLSKMLVFACPYDPERPFYLKTYSPALNGGGSFLFCNKTGFDFTETLHYVVYSQELGIKYVFTVTEEADVDITVMPYHPNDTHVYVMFRTHFNPFAIQSMLIMNWFAAIPIEKDKVHVFHEKEELRAYGSVMDQSTIDYAKFEQTHAFLYEEDDQKMINILKEENGKLNILKRIPCDKDEDIKSITFLDENTLIYVSGNYVNKLMI